MIRGILLSLLLCVGGASFAQNILPAYFHVVDVASDDALNIRSNPTPSSEIINSFGPHAAYVEITELSSDRKWGRVNLHERSGWVFMRYLRQHSDTGAELYESLQCYGTEPFWSLDLTKSESSKFALMGKTDRQFDVPFPVQTSNRTDHFVGQNENGFVAIMRDQCSDGMSDAVFGLRVILGMNGHSYSGCCRLN